LSRPWRIELAPRAQRSIDKLTSVKRRRIVRFLEERIAGPESPRRIGEALKGPPDGLWRYRVGDYRIIVRIEDRVLTVLVLEVGHRREVFR
jgi:mRNA interferase RelE/StbE